MTKRIRIFITRHDFKSSIKDLSADTSDEFFINPDDTWIEVEERTPHIFTIMGENITDENSRLDFLDWDSEVEDISIRGCKRSGCGAITQLLWNEVYLSTQDLRASSLERLVEALNHVNFYSESLRSYDWDHDDYPYG